MQFPWRDYIWLVILLSLAIGLAVQQMRIGQLTVFREQADAAEQTARGLANEIANKTGTSNPHFFPFWSVQFKKDGQETKYVYVRGMNSAVRALSEGMSGAAVVGGLDHIAVMLILPFLFASFYFLGPQATSSRDILIDGAIQILPLVALSIVMYASMLPFARYGSRPLPGAFLLSVSVLLFARYVTFAELPSEQRKDWIARTNANKGALHVLRQGLRIRFHLRDVLWLMPLIGLLCAVCLENHRAQRLHDQDYRADWWAKAVSALQTASELPSTSP